MMRKLLYPQMILLLVKVIHPLHTIFIYKENSIIIILFTLVILNSEPLIRVSIFFQGFIHCSTYRPCHIELLLYPLIEWLDFCFIYTIVSACEVIFPLPRLFYLQYFMRAYLSKLDTYPHFLSKMHSLTIFSIYLDFPPLLPEFISATTLTPPPSLLY